MQLFYRLPGKLQKNERYLYATALDNFRFLQYNKVQTERRKEPVMDLYFLDITTLTETELTDAYFHMSEDRKDRCKKITDIQGKKQCIAADLAIRRLAAPLLKIAPDEIEIQKTPEGKPFIPDTSFHISVTHSEDLACCALSEFPVGIDAERIRSVSRKAKERVCDEEELSYLSEADHDLRFLTLWTGKEALFKMGITLPIKDIHPLHPERYNANLTTRIQNCYVISIAEQTE